jgi:hypothetical protein
MCGMLRVRDDFASLNLRKAESSRRSSVGVLVKS